MARSRLSFECRRSRPSAVLARQSNENHRRLRPRQRRGCMDSHDRPAPGEVYSRKSKYCRSEYARGRCDGCCNYVYKVAKPDGLTLGGIRNGLYFDQLVGRKEVQFDWPKFTWLGTPTQVEQIIYMRANTPYKTIQDVRQAAVPPRCGATGTASTGYLLGNLLEDTLGAKFNTLTGYKDGPEVDLAVEREEIHCRGISLETLFGREPLISWSKNGFVRVLVQTGKKRDSRL